MQPTSNVTTINAPMHDDFESSSATMIIKFNVDRSKYPDRYEKLIPCSPRQRANRMRSLELKHLLSVAGTSVPAVKGDGQAS